MSIFSSYWFWIVVVVLLGGWSLFGRGHGRSTDTGHSQLPVGYGHSGHDEHGTMNSGPQTSESQDQHQGHKHHGGCC